MATCWYCEKRSADPKSAYEFKMHQHAPPYRSTAVSVPRCEECWAIHGRIQRLARIIAIVFFVVPTVLCLLLFLLRSILEWRLPWGIPVAVAVVTGAIIIGIPSLWERRMLKSVGTKYENKAYSEYPEAKELKQDGWKLSEKVRRPAVPATRKRPALDRRSCAVCGTQWSRAVMDMTRGSQRYVHGAVQAGSSQYAGTCPECRRAYCARCAHTREAGLGVKISQCPDCRVDLLASLSD
jgi:hypothetical protein